MDQNNYPKYDYVMEREGLDKVCPFSLKKDNGVQDPHRHEVRDYSTKIKDDITDCIGNTPMVRLSNIMKDEGLECELLGKCEYLNPGGSVKDRIGRRMVLDAEASGRIKKGDILIEPTSGNTGIGLAMTAACKGYKMIITLPEKMSQEKQDALSGLGATILRTPTELPWDHVDCHIGVALQQNQKLENSHILDQYRNPANPLVHYDETGTEIYEQCSGKIDYCVISAGTGGTLTGISRKLKELNPDIQIIAIDPDGSILAQPEELNVGCPHTYKVEGIGYDFIPRVIDRQFVDKWYKVGDNDSFKWARRLIRNEGMLVGGSSGTALAGALAAIKDLKIGAGKRVVVILPDSLRNYMTKFLNNDWMYENGFISEEQCYKLNQSELVPSQDWGQEYTVSDLNLTDAVFLKHDQTIAEALELMQNYNFDQFPVKNEEGEIIGMITSTILTNKLVKKKVNMKDVLSKALVKEYRNVSSTIPLHELGRIFSRNQFVIVDQKYVASSFDLLRFMKEKMQ